MPTPKYKINDQVNKKINTGVYLATGAAVGTIIEIKEKYNVRNRISYYYVVRWEDQRRSEHAQHILTPAP
jgi:uridine kinase